MKKRGTMTDRQTLGALRSAASSLPARVALIYSAVAVVATILAFSSYDSVYFLPLLALAWPIGIELLTRFDGVGPAMQTTFLVAGIGINALVAGAIVAAVARSG
jgi:hypothetical protein